jgi:Na+-driven multidrug efflux pump
MEYIVLIVEFIGFLLIAFKMFKVMINKSIPFIMSLILYVFIFFTTVLLFGYIQKKLDVYYLLIHNFYGFIAATLNYLILIFTIVFSFFYRRKLSSK